MVLNAHSCDVNLSNNGANSNGKFKYV